jgi:hypothetical protein
MPRCERCLLASPRSPTILVERGAVTGVRIFTDGVVGDLAQQVTH